MRVSLVTATYNRAQQLRRGIFSVLRQEGRLPDEIIVVDDGSKDKGKTVGAVNQIKRLCKAKGVDFKYIYLNYPEARISCIPRNIGFKQSTGDIVIFTESECLHIGNTIEQLLKKMEENPDRTPVATQVWTMGKLIYEGVNHDHFAHPEKLLEHPYAFLTDSANMENFKAPNSDLAITGSINCLTGCLFAVRREWMEDIGGFDESFEGHGWDDFDLFNRLALYGKGVLNCNDIIVIHQYHDKNYPYNIYHAAEKNSKTSEARTRSGEYRANIGKEWGVK